MHYGAFHQILSTFAIRVCMKIGKMHQFKATLKGAATIQQSFNGSQVRYTVSVKYKKKQDCTKRIKCGMLASWKICVQALNVRFH